MVDHTPVLIGAGQFTYRGDPAASPSPTQLLKIAAERAASDAGIGAAGLAGLDSIVVAPSAIAQPGASRSGGAPFSSNAPAQLAAMTGAQPRWAALAAMGGNSSQIATLVERRSRYVMLVKLGSKSTLDVVPAVAKAIRRLPAQLRRTLTWDRGSEMAAHKEFTVATDVQVYFCDPHSPWQRGSNENTNGLLRQYFPKGEDVSWASQAELNRVAKLLNERPRETLGWLTPHEVLRKTVASTS